MNQVYTPSEVTLLVECIRSGQVDPAGIAQLLADPQIAQAYNGR